MVARAATLAVQSLLLAAAQPGMGPAPIADTARFQQGVEYTIEALLDERTNILHGRALLRYVNRSPLALDTLYFQQYLNAFRPNSEWARRDLEAGIRTFQDLDPEEHAFERLRRVTVDGVEALPVYPGAPDSTVLAVPLAAALEPGGTVTVELDWEARLSTEPRRQGRRGRHFDFAQWYPRIAVVERDGWHHTPLIRAGEFYGEFGRYDVTLDLSEDQVVGATGVPLMGDPGWSRVAVPGFDVPEVAAGAGVAPASLLGLEEDRLGFLDAEPERGRQRVRFVADSVHHFAWSASPDFIYEGGDWNGVAVHVLYRPEGAAEWGEGIALQRTFNALDWMAELFAPYPWPQLTNLHRIESGGTEFPMLMMDGSASQGLIVHEVAHQYVHGILANNEWREAWLDEGFASFLTDWYFEAAGQEGIWDRGLQQLRELERAGRTEPVAQPADRFSSYAMYRTMSYGKGSAFFLMMRELLGEDTFREGLRLYYERNAFRHVREEDLRKAMETAAGGDLGWFFHQWLHTTWTMDYRVEEAVASRLPDGRWRTRIVVAREGRAWMPIQVEVAGERHLLESPEPRQALEVISEERPLDVVIDPDGLLLDIRPENDRRLVTERR